MESLLAVLLAYLIGSLSFAVLVSRLMGLSDPRTYGSGNPGATNVLRSGNKAAAALTLLLDAAKGWLPVWVVAHWGGDWGLSDAVLAPVALAAFAGHVWPVFFRFQGGKGVATAAGVLMGIQPLLGLATLATWLILVFFSRTSSLGAIGAAVFAPFFYLLGVEVAWPGQPGLGLAIVTMGAILLYRHKANIGRLLKGTEPRLGQGKRD
ncbi:MAG: glycerol-3-phosphate 1-O-acyltransferase PlsY [Alphaproteobacteria bacterium]|nr:glycerol-3-phosphate 1-O-acyltransferase PlsY [Alphaproteobacteria bacterium]